MTDEEIMHYGILRRSGRYPWGSGSNPYQRGMNFLGYVDELRNNGLTDTEIAKSILDEDGRPWTTTQLRAATAISRHEKRSGDVALAVRLKEKGLSNVAIGERMGINESSVRALLNTSIQENQAVLKTTANILKKNVDEKGYIDVGAGVEHDLGISSTKLNTALAMLKEEGYEVHKVKIEQLGTGHMTEVKVLAPPGKTGRETFKDIVTNPEKINLIGETSDDRGRTYEVIGPPKNVSGKRVKVAYAEEGGADRDGVIYIRPGVKDLSLGSSRYAQVRIAIDGTHYLKGMAIYKTDLPDGVDIVFNTNKSSTGNPKDAMKLMGSDPENPFSSNIRRQSGALNILREEGDWHEWSRTFSSQMLSKQGTELAKRQLGLSFDIKRAEFDEINALTNPVVKQRLMEAFADSADSSAVHLKAASLPRTRNHVILPIPSLKDNEVYAPNFRSGETVVLIRHPHGGIFEIPQLTVNNRHRESRAIIGQAKDAIGINPQVAKQLSGADFDGDSVLVIPNPGGKPIKSSSPLGALKDFDPLRYKLPEDAPKLSDTRKQQLMGDVSNLITDMTIKGAHESEIARAVKHSMVVIDAEKHHLDYKQSALDNGIKELKVKYQERANAGSATLISRASSPTWVDERKPRTAAKGGPVDPKTGRLMFEPTGRTYVNKKGDVVTRQTKTTKMAVVEDARSLMSKPGTSMEMAYADHANKLKALANQARKTALETKPTPYSPSARGVYAEEVAALNSALAIAQRNAPLERRAQILANAAVKARRLSNPDVTGDFIKKIRGQELERARLITGAKKQQIKFTPRQWEAIQAGAITASKLKEILKHADLDEVKKLATPRPSRTLSKAIEARAMTMLAAGYTQAEIADALGVSTSTINKLVG